jgi:hypothetical protein
MTLQLVNQHPKYSPPRFVEPPPYGYIYIGAAVEPPKGRAPLPGRSAQKTELLARLGGLIDRLAEHPDVVRATLYRATLMPPVASAGRSAAFDVAVLIEVRTPASLDQVSGSDGYTTLVDTLNEASSQLYVMRATCIRCIADVEKVPRGTYLFNHFLTEASPEDAVALWEHLSGWYTVETDLDNSTLLAPTEGSASGDFVFVNHARWDHGVGWVMLHQLAKSTFRSYVLANLKANRTQAIPVLYRLLRSSSNQQ